MSHTLGVQSWTYRDFSHEEIIDELDGTDIEAIELCRRHVSPEADADEVERIRGQYESNGISVCGYGVYDFASLNEVTAVADLAAVLDVSYLSVNFEPDHEEVIERLEAVATERDLDVAIHNHGPSSTFPRVDDVASVLEGRSERFGACVDTGHFFRSGESPSQVVPRLGERVHAIHLKDFRDADTEVVPGYGQLDIDGFLTLLDEHTSFGNPLVIEYENDADDPTPAVRKTAERVQTADS